MKEPDPGFMCEGKDGIVSKMATVVDVGDPKGDFGRKVKLVGKIEFDAGHGCLSTKLREKREKSLAVFDRNQ
jgi:hypothetical protein